MRPEFTKKFDEAYIALPPYIRGKFDKQLRHLLTDLRHPSLRTKKYDEANDIWQARVDGHYRFYFQIRGNIYYLLYIRKHKD